MVSSTSAVAAAAAAASLNSFIGFSPSNINAAGLYTATSSNGNSPYSAYSHYIQGAAPSENSAVHSSSAGEIDYKTAQSHNLQTFLNTGFFLPVRKRIKLAEICFYQGCHTGSTRPHAMASSLHPLPPLQILVWIPRRGCFQQHFCLVFSWNWWFYVCAALIRSN